MPLTREELKERLVTLHEVSLELVSNVSIDSLLERIVSLACEQSGAKYGALGVLDDSGRLKQFITHGLSSDEIKRISHPPVGLGLIGELMHGDSNSIRIPEIAKDPRSHGFPSGHPEMHSMLGVPIRRGERQLGQLYLTEKQNAKAFSSEDQTIIEILAAYAGVAIENARLYEELQNHDQTLTKRNEELALINDIGAALSLSLDLDEILNKTLALLIAHFKVEVGEIFLIEDDKETLRLVLHRGEAAEAFWSRNRYKIGEGLVGKAAQSKQALLSNLLEQDDLVVRKELIEEGFKQFACIPLTTHNEVVGVLAFATRNKKALLKKDMPLLSSVATGAGTAIENARLHSNVRRMAVLEERERFGMDLHDGVIQSIYGVGLEIENARNLLKENPSIVDERLKGAIHGLNRTITDIRTYILDLRPRQLRGESLIEGLGRLVSEFRQNSKVEVTLAGPKDNLADMPQINAMALFHICQEALANIGKHANASKVTIDLWTTSDRVLLEVHDNGKGFDWDNVTKSVGHGLSNMQTRMSNVGGDIDIISGIDEGTTILAWVPRKSAPEIKEISP